VSVRNAILKLWVPVFFWWKNFGYPNNTLIFDIVNGFLRDWVSLKVSSISGYKPSARDWARNVYAYVYAMLELLIRGYGRYDLVRSPVLPRVRTGFCFHAYLELILYCPNSELLTSPSGLPNHVTRANTMNTLNYMLYASKLLIYRYLRLHRVQCLYDRLYNHLRLLGQQSLFKIPFPFLLYWLDLPSWSWIAFYQQKEKPFRVIETEWLMLTSTSLSLMVASLRCHLPFGWWYEDIYRVRKLQKF